MNDVTDDITDDDLTRWGRLQQESKYSEDLGDDVLEENILNRLIAEVRKLRAEPRVNVTRTNWKPNPIIDDGNQLSAAESIRIISEPK